MEESTSLLQPSEAEHPLPPRGPDMVLATPDMFRPLGPDSYRPLADHPQFGIETRYEGIGELTDGKLGWRFTRHEAGASGKPTPWHYHDLDYHVLYIIKGWITLEFEGMGPVRMEAGTICHQPVRNRHREIGMSDDLELIEITMPEVCKTTFYVYDDAAGAYSEVVVDEETDRKSRRR